MAALSRTHCCRWKEISITCSDYVCVALVIQHTKRMLPIILSVVCSALQYFSTFSHKRHRCRKKKSWDVKYVLISLKLLSETFVILRRNE